QSSPEPATQEHPIDQETSPQRPHTTNTTSPSLIPLPPPSTINAPQETTQDATQDASQDATRDPKTTRKEPKSNKRTPEPSPSSPSPTPPAKHPHSCTHTQTLPSDWDTPPATSSDEEGVELNPGNQVTREALEALKKADSQRDRTKRNLLQFCKVID